MCVQSSPDEDAGCHHEGLNDPANVAICRNKVQGPDARFITETGLKRGSNAIKMALLGKLVLFSS